MTGIQRRIFWRSFLKKQKKADVRYAVGSLANTTIERERLGQSFRNSILDMCFQMGVRGFRRFKRLLKAVEQRNFELAAFECLTSKYAQQTPKRAKRIAQLLKTGVWK